MGKSWDESNYYIGKDNMTVDRINEILQFFVNKFSEYYGIENLTKFEDLMAKEKGNAEDKKEMQKGFIMQSLNEPLGSISYFPKQSIAVVEFDLNPYYKKFARKRILKSIQKMLRSLFTYLMSLPQFKNKTFGPILASKLKELTTQEKVKKEDSSFKKFNIEKVSHFQFEKDNVSFEERKFKSDFEFAYAQACDNTFGSKYMCLLLLLLDIANYETTINLFTAFHSCMSYEEYRQIFLLLGLFMKDIPVYKEAPFDSDPGFILQPKDLSCTMAYTVLGKFFDLPHSYTRSCSIGPLDFFVFYVQDYENRANLKISPVAYKDFGMVVEDIVGENYMPHDYKCYSLKKVDYPYGEERIHKAAYVVSYFKVPDEQSARSYLDFNINKDEQLNKEEEKNKAAYLVSYRKPYGDYPCRYLVDANQQNPIFYFPENSILIIEELELQYFNILVDSEIKEENEFKVAEFHSYNYSNASIDLVLNENVKFEAGEKKLIKIVNLEFHKQMINLRSRYLRIGLTITNVKDNIVTVVNYGS